MGNPGAPAIVRKRARDASLGMNLKGADRDRLFSASVERLYRSAVLALKFSVCTFFRFPSARSIGRFHMVAEGPEARRFSQPSLLSRARLAFA